MARNFDVKFAYLFTTYIWKGVKHDTNIVFHLSVDYAWKTTLLIGTVIFDLG